VFQFPEIHLGILPGVGGCIVPYRRWPKGAALFNEMVILGRPLSAKEAVEIGMVSGLVEAHSRLVPAAIEELDRISGRPGNIPDGQADCGQVSVPDRPMAGKRALSMEAVSIAVETIKGGCAAATFEEALEVGYKGFARTGCTDAAREGISAFLEKRKPTFHK
jgi:enoyl-CoA hydratase/3-hydroxyacyl-CoA dehydrogenase